MSEGYWICRDCAGIYRIPLDARNYTTVGGRLHLISHLGPCPLCGNVRKLYKAEELEKCPSRAQSLTAENRTGQEA